MAAYATFPFAAFLFRFSFSFRSPFRYTIQFSYTSFALLTGGGLSIGSGSGHVDRPEATGSGHSRYGEAESPTLRGIPHPESDAAE